jgi:hypothetical protein
MSEIIRELQSAMLDWIDLKDEENADLAKRAIERIERLEIALHDAVLIANDAAEEWDTAPSGMKAGKILLALAGHNPRYRPDTDRIHATLKEI